MANSWIAKCYRSERENDRLLRRDYLMLNDPGRLLTKQEVKELYLEPTITREMVEATKSEESSIGQSIPWRTGCGGQVPLSYQYELFDDRVRAAKKLAGIKHSNRDLFGELAVCCFVGVGTGLVGTVAGAIGGYLLSDNHPILMTLGGTVGGAIGTPTILGLGAYIVSKIEDKIYESAMRNHRNKKNHLNRRLKN
ncbi:MAG: hypothetical protein AABW65_00895 [Nanoarchaeota archaeon]